MPTLPTTASIQLGIGAQYTNNYTIQNPDGSLFPITGTTWEFAVRNDPSELVSVNPLIKVTTTSSASGLITINTSTSVVSLTVAPVATGVLTQKQYVYSLWMNPGTTTATAWFTGTLFATFIALA